MIFIDTSFTSFYILILFTNDWKIFFDYWHCRYGEISEEYGYGEISEEYDSPFMQVQLIFWRFFFK